MCLVLQSIGVEINWSGMTVGVMLGVVNGRGGLKSHEATPRVWRQVSQRVLCRAWRLSVVLGVAEGALWRAWHAIMRQGLCRGFGVAWSVAGEPCASVRGAASAWR